MKTKRILTNQAAPGMVVADDVYTFNNQLIIARNSVLTNRTITRLKFYSINDIRIVIEDEIRQEEAAPEAAAPAEDQPDISYREYVKSTPEFHHFNEEFNTGINRMEDTMQQFVNHQISDIDVSVLLTEAKKILSESRNGMHVFHMLQCMRDYDDLTYAHSLSVALICNVFGRWLNFSAEDVDALTVAGLLHDLGKLYIPHQIISKPSSLTPAEYNIIKTHPLQGYNAVKEQKLDSRVKYAILMHHERCDGTGYPSGLSSKQIDYFAKIVAIADVYEAMTSARVYREAICPFEVINVFETEGLQKHDPKYLLVFLTGMVQTYMNAKVCLNNGMEGRIVLINKLSLARPVVKVGRGYIDLSKNPDLYISKLL